MQFATRVRTLIASVVMQYVKGGESRIDTTMKSVRGALSMTCRRMYGAFGPLLGKAPATAVRAGPTRALGVNAWTQAMIFRAMLVALGFSTVTPARAQLVVWTQRAVEGPSARSGHAMAYDAARGVTVLFGGADISGQPIGETWLWNGTAWTQQVVGEPAARGGHAMAYDAARDVTVLFGGYSSDGYNGETWEWNGTAWIQQIVMGPSPRNSHAMAYDAARGVTVLFGGVSNGNFIHGDTWEWNGTAWSMRTTSGPSPRVGHAMVYDAIRGVTVLFGGRLSNGAYNDETWEWNGTAWTQRIVSGPPPRFEHAMAYDAARELTVLFGGFFFDGSSHDYADTWEWNGTAWMQQVITEPSPRRGHTMSSDAARGVNVLFGGHDDANDANNGETWELCTSPSISVQPSARTACPGGSAGFTVIAEGSGPFSYQWQLQTAPDTWQTLGNDPFPLPCGGGAFAYAAPLNSANVQIGIRPCPGVTRYQIRAVISNDCGSVTSNEATYTICPADFNCDNAVSSQDFFDFLTAFFAADPHSDFNADGVFNSQDFFDFLTAFFAGC
jgi:hypothetical protein